mmetsp:Transcript_34180/g.72974  ORF Transcript_34180/g.72974 Transcript_34180/m.72974 type:complete len:214 (+) Transcript_34180:743-1384(+)
MKQVLRGAVQSGGLKKPTVGRPAAYSRGRAGRPKGSSRHGRRRCCHMRTLFQPRCPSLLMVLLIMAGVTELTTRSGEWVSRSQGWLGWAHWRVVSHDHCPPRAGCSRNLRRRLASVQRARTCFLLTCRYRRHRRCPTRLCRSTPRGASRLSSRCTIRRCSNSRIGRCRWLRRGSRRAAPRASMPTTAARQGDGFEREATIDYARPRASCSHEQ